MATAAASTPVLIVDDDESYAGFVRLAFDADGEDRFDLSHVTRLADALPALRRQPALVVLLDISLPDGNGLEWLKAHRGEIDAAVVVLTGDATYAAAEQVIAGAQDFLVKSEVDPQQIKRAVRYAADRELARRELVRSREYFQSLIEQARDLITVVDDRGIILYQSPGTLHLLGQPPEAFVGRSLYSIVDEQQAAQGRALLESVMRGQSDVPSGQFVIRRPDGSVRHLDVVASRIAPENGVQRVVLNSRDVTERRRAEEALRVRDDMLRQAQKMEAVGRLAGGIAHDFSNVLTVITAACERLRDRIAPIDPASSDPGSEIGMILRHCQRAAALTRHLLAFSRQQTLAPRRIDLRALVEETSELIAQLIGEEMALEIDVARDLRAVAADPVQIQQVLMNLAINARDAMPGGGLLRVTIANCVVDEAFAAAHPPMPAGEFVLLQVSDTGTGMTEETRAKAFEPFFTTKPPHRGSGLGLSTVYGIVKQSGGYVWIDSEPGAGTSVSVYLPPTTGQPAVEPAPRDRRAHTPASKTVLLTEDEDDVRELLRDMLTAQGYNVLSASNPDDALARARAHGGRIDLLLTDVVMPGGTGRDLARQMTASRPLLKVLYMSGYPEHGAAPGSVLEPGSPFLAKPFTRDLLLQKMRELLG